MRLITHLYLVLRLRVSEAVHLLCLYAFMACTGKTLLFLCFSYSAVTTVDGVVFLVV
jgi:hypothetical protein